MVLGPVGSLIHCTTISVDVGLSSFQLSAQFSLLLDLHWLKLGNNCSLLACFSASGWDLNYQPWQSTAPSALHRSYVED